MQTPRSPPIAISGGADRRENGENAELAPLRENSAADHPLRQQPRPRACGRACVRALCLMGKASCRNATDTSGRKIRGVVKNSSRQQFLGLWSFFCRLHLHSSENTEAP
jgi:hypothetical protein